MRKIIPIIIIALIIAEFSDIRSSKTIDELGMRKYIKKEKLFFFIMAIVMSVFVGLRTRGNDTQTYIWAYEFIPKDMSAFSINWTSLASAPGFSFTLACLKSLGASSQDFIMIFALFTNLVYLWFLRKYTDNLLLSTYYYITMGVYTFTLAAIKQTTAVAFLLLGTDRLIEGKKLFFLFWVLIAILFHPYAIIYILLLFSFNYPFSKRTGILVIITLFVAIFLQRFTGSILQFTGLLGYDYYAQNEFNQEGVNVFRVLVVSIPILLAFIVRAKLHRTNDGKMFFLINASMYCALIMFVGLFGTANYFARLANYFLIFQSISLPFIIELFDNKTKSILKTLSVIMFAVYCWYDLVVAHGVFDKNYYFISLLEYFGK